MTSDPLRSIVWRAPGRGNRRCGDHVNLRPRRQEKSPTLSSRAKLELSPVDASWVRGPPAWGGIKIPVPNRDWGKRIPEDLTYERWSSAPPRWGPGNKSPRTRGLQIRGAVVRVRGTAPVRWPQGQVRGLTSVDLASCTPPFRPPSCRVNAARFSGPAFWLRRPLRGGKCCPFF